MPELPEVETIRRGLASQILHKTVASIEVRKRSLVKNPLNKFLKILQRNKFLQIERLGKLLIWHLHSGQYYMLVHLKMTGQLIYVVKGKIIAGGHNLPNFGNLPNKYSHIIINFTDGSKLFFNDLRQFGYFKLVNLKQKEKLASKFGIEPLTKDFTLVNFSKIFIGRKGTIKSILLNQNLIAGIGNIYADEICFQAKILPTRHVDKLTKIEIKNLFNSCQQIIRRAIKFRGTTFNDYRDSGGQRGNFSKYLKVYGRSKKKCLRCQKGIIKKLKVAGRGTHYCKNCQK